MGIRREVAPEPLEGRDNARHDRFLEWVRANGLDPNRVVYRPLEVTDDGQLLFREFLHYPEGHLSAGQRILCAHRMDEDPHIAKMVAAAPMVVAPEEFDL